MTPARPAAPVVPAAPALAPAVAVVLRYRHAPLRVAKPVVVLLTEEVLVQSVIEKMLVADIIPCAIRAVPALERR